MQTDAPWQDLQKPATNLVLLAASAANSPLPYFSRVKALERSLFGQDYVDGKTGDDGSKQLKTNRRKSVLDVLRADVNRLEKRTPAEFKDKVYGVLESFESFDNKKQELRLTSITFFHSSVFILIDKLSIFIPALLISISKPPNSNVTLSINSSILE